MSSDDFSARAADIAEHMSPEQREWVILVADAHKKGVAEGECAATERIIGILEARPLAFIDFSTMRDIIAVIRGGQHE